MLLSAQGCSYLADVAFKQGPFKPSCLLRSMALYGLLRSKAIDCQFRVGVRPAGSTIAAHAWIEVEGVSLDASSQEYSAFSQLSSATSGIKFE